MEGRLTGLKCVRCDALEPDRTGRARIAARGEEVILPAQTLILAGAQEPDLTVLAGGPDLSRTPWNLLVVDPVSLATSEPGVFAAGEVTTGGATVIEAVTAGQKAAVTIHRYLRGLEQSDPYRFVRPRRRVEFADTGEALDNFKRPEQAMRPASERAHDFREADITYSEMLAVCEAKRCLHCDLD